MTLQRKTAMPRKRAGRKRRTLLPRCTVRGCTRIARYDDLCTPHARSEADRLFSVFIRNRDGRCLNCSALEGLQCAHILSRGARYIRLDPDNAVALCSGCHLAFTRAPGRWAVWVEENLPGRWTTLVHRERQGEHYADSVDYAAVLEWLRAEVAA